MREARILRSEADDNTRLRLLETSYSSYEEASREARRLRKQEVKAHGSWADYFFAMEWEVEE